QRFADRVGHFEQNVAVARGAHEVPEVETLVERQRFEDERDAGWVKAVELVDELGLALLVHGGFGELGFAGRCAFSTLFADKPFDEPMLAQESRDADERILDACRRFGWTDVCVVGSVEHHRVQVGDLSRDRAAGILTLSPRAKLARYRRRIDFKGRRRPASVRGSSMCGPRDMPNRAVARTTADWVSSPRAAPPARRRAPPPKRRSSVAPRPRRQTRRCPIR